MARFPVDVQFNPGRQHPVILLQQPNGRADPARQAPTRAVSRCSDAAGNNLEQAARARQVEAFLAGAARIEEQPVAERGEARWWVWPKTTTPVSSSKVARNFSLRFG